MGLDRAGWYWPYSRVPLTPHAPQFHTGRYSTHLLLRPYNFCAFSTSCTPAVSCVSTVRCTSEPAFLRFHDSLCFHRSLHLHDLLPHRVLAPSRLIAQYIAIASGQFYWAMHPMSSQQSLTIWGILFWVRPDSLLPLHSFHPSRFWKPSFPNHPFGERIQKKDTAPSSYGARRLQTRIQGQSRPTEADGEGQTKDRERAKGLRYNQILPPNSRTYRANAPRQNFSTQKQHKSSIKAAGRTDYCAPCCFIGRADLSDLPSVCFSSHVIANMNFSRLSCHPDRPDHPAIPETKYHPETAPQHIQPLLAPFCALHEPPTGY